MKSRLKDLNSALAAAGLLILVATVGAFLAGCGRDSDSAPAGAAPAEKTLYTCGMHPQIIQDHPGNCPICGMKLTPIRKQGRSTATNSLETSTAIAIDPVTRQNMNLRTTEVVRGPLRRTLRTVGAIDYNETALADVTTKFKGWIETLHADATGQLVHRGEPLFEVYSPELYSAEVEYLLALSQTVTNDTGTEVLRQTAANKLKFYDISEAQIAEIERTREPRKTLEILAPIDGFITEKMIVRGQMVDPGMKLYRLADLGIVWVFAQIYEQDLPYVRLGQEATVRIASLPDREFRGRVTYVYPNVDEKTRTARVRMEFENPGYFLKPGMFVSVEITSEIEPSALLIPDSAILRSGEKNTVFVALDDGHFDARTVALGLGAENAMSQVLGGLKEGERIVTSGQFMLDSESQLREAIAKMQGPTSNAPEISPIPATAPAGQPPSTNAPPEGIVYVCPMPAHVSIAYDHEGNCPICGMALVPVTQTELNALQPGGSVLYYTCPMPGHSNVRSDKPGKCPICGMTLIPVMSSPATNRAAPGATAVTNPESSTLPVLYTCRMASHEMVTNKPGVCPICDMELVPTSTVPHGKAMEDKWRRTHPQ